MKKSLSPREKEIAMYLSEGQSTKMIASKIGIKSNTVSTYKKNLFFKLEVDTTIDLYKKLNDNYLLLI
jgi:DNA-binding NarL/FixJ family response regulator